MLYILWGQDDFSLNQALDKIKGDIGDQAVLSTDTTTLDGHQTSLEQLRSVCETFPFLAEKRLVIVKGLLERFEPRGKSSRQKKAAQLDSQQDERKSLSDSIGRIPDSTVLVLVDNDITANNPLLRELADKAEVRSFPPLKDAELRKWAQQRVAEQGGSISAGAVELMVKLVGGNLWHMANEIDKLVIFAAGRRIEEDDVRMIVSYAREANVFAMVDAILGFNVGEAERWLEYLLQRGATPAYLMFMLSRQLQMIVRAKELRSQGEAKADIQSKLNLTSEFALRKTLEQAGRYPGEQIKRVYGKLLETDLAIKTGKYDSGLALNILIAELCRQQRV